MLDDLRSIPWYAALALVLAGAIVAIGLAVAIDSVGGSTVKSMRVELHRTGAGSNHAAGGQAAGKTRPKLVIEAESPPAESASIPRMVGQRFMVGLRGASPTSALLADARKGEIGGVVIFPEDSNPVSVKKAVVKLQQAADEGENPPLLIATDQEGGPVKRFSAGPPDVPPSSFTPRTAQREGAATGSYLHRHGINVDLAPVVDLGLPGSFMAAEHRTISENPLTVSNIATGFSRGLMSRGVMPVPKHFPGLGLASRNTDGGRVVVEGDINPSLVPYSSLIANRIPAIMVSTAIYPQFDSVRGAAWSPKIVHGQLRKRLGFRKLVISDDLSSHGVRESLSTPEAATDTAKAGVDMVMIVDPEWFHPAHDAVLRAAERGQISMSNLDSSYRRIRFAKERLTP